MKNLVLVTGMNKLGIADVHYTIYDTFPCLKTEEDGLVEFNEAYSSKKQLKLEYFDFIDLGEVLRNTDNDKILSHFMILAQTQITINSL